MTKSLVPPPSPEDVRSWSDFTARLREMHAWCGSPKYRALSGRVPRLSPAAISQLIGRSAVSRPPRAASLRFVEACLRYRGWPDMAAELSQWAGSWTRLAASPAAVDARVAVELRTAASAQTAPDAGGRAPGTTATPASTGAESAAMAATVTRGAHPRRRSLEVAIPAVAATLVAVGTTILAMQADTGSAATCQRRTKASVTDARHGLNWHPVYLCWNKPGTPLYANPRLDTPIGYLNSDQNWFACWTHGAPHGGGNDIWYYTQGDRTAGRPELRAWGFMPASAMLAWRHPDPGISRPCPFPGSVLDQRKPSFSKHD